MCVASYGVMPQTYIRAGPSAGVTSRRRPVELSKTRTAGPRTPSGRAVVPTTPSGAVHACMPSSLSTTLRTAATGSRASHRAASGSVRTRSSRSHRRATASTSRTVSRSSSASRRSPSSPASTDSTPAQLVGREGLPGPAPEHGAQLVLAVEADPVVDAVAVTAGHRQHVTALAVGVVRDQVEDRHPAQGRGVLVHQHHRLVVRPARVERRAGSRAAPAPRVRRPPGPGRGPRGAPRTPSRAAPCRVRRDRRAAPSGARCPSRGGRRPPRRRTPGPRGCRR